MIDVGRYIGLRYESRGRTREGLDCWGLVRLVYLETYAIELPTYSAEYIDSAEAKETARVIAENQGDWAEVSDPVEGDVVLLALQGAPTHVGVYLGDGSMLHVRRGVDSCVERIDTRLWKPRVVGFFRFCPT